MYWVVFSKCAESSLEATTKKSKECQDMKGENVPVDDSDKIKYTFKCIFHIHSQNVRPNCITLRRHAGLVSAHPPQLQIWEAA